MDKQTEQRIIETTTQLLHEHGLSDWKVRFSKAYRRFGSCSYQTKTIRISHIFAAQRTWEETHKTILHEVAHAIAGSRAGHSFIWKNVARQIGLKNPERTTSSTVDTNEPWVATCPNGHTISRVYTPRRVQACAICCKGKFQKEFLFDWKKNGQKVPMSQAYQAEYNRMHAKPTVPSHEKQLEYA